MILAIAMAGCVNGIDDTSEVPSAVGVGPGALAQLAGPRPWTCTGYYLDAPPFTFAHAFAADFVVTIVGNGIVGAYQETQITAPISVSDRLTAVTATIGIRVFDDSNGGHESGGYTLLLTDTRGQLSSISFVGTYTILGLDFPFSESLEVAGDTFALTASVAGMPFQIQTCIRQSGE
jgi:hypothetical protein